MDKSKKKITIEGFCVVIGTETICNQKHMNIRFCERPLSWIHISNKTLKYWNSRANSNKFQLEHPYVGRKFIQMVYHLLFNVLPLVDMPKEFIMPIKYFSPTGLLGPEQQWLKHWQLCSNDDHRLNINICSKTLLISLCIYKRRSLQNHFW